MTFNPYGKIYQCDKHRVENCVECLIARQTIKLTNEFYEAKEEIKKSNCVTLFIVGALYALCITSCILFLHFNPVKEYCTPDYCIKQGQTIEQLGLEPDLRHYNDNIEE